MYARITRFRIKPDAREAAARTLEELKPRILAQPGMQHFINVMNVDGDGYVIALTDNETVSEAGSEQIRAIWSTFSEHLAAPPEAPATYEVLADWKQ